MDGEPKDISQKDKTVNRRSFNKWVGAGVVALATKFSTDKKFIPSQSSNEDINKRHELKLDDTKNPDPIEINSNTAPTSEILSEQKVIFEDQQTDEITKSLDLTIEDIMNPNFDKIHDFRGFLSNELQPIFYPKVHLQKDLIYDLSKEHDIPANVIAFLMSIESGGDENAKSDTDDRGIFQVNGIHTQHLDDNEVFDPKTNGKLAMSIYKDCLNAAKDYYEEQHKTFDNNDPTYYLRACAMYNAGQTGGKGEFNKINETTDHYVRAAARSFQMAEISERLRASGETNEQIVENLRSSDIDARVYAMLPLPNSLDQTEVYKFASSDMKQIDSTWKQELKSGYDKYHALSNDEKHEQFPRPENPFIRLLDSLGRNLAAAYPENNEPINWTSINTTPSNI